MTLCPTHRLFHEHPDECEEIGVASLRRAFGGTLPSEMAHSRRMELVALAFVSTVTDPEEQARLWDRL